MSDVDLIINVHTNGIKDVANLSASVKALTANLREITIPMSKLDVQSRAVNKALGMTNRGMNDHAKTIKQLKENQRALGEESKRLKSNITAYTGAIRSAGGPTTALGRELVSTKAHLQAMSAAMRGARVRAFGSDIASISLKMQKMGKDFQFVGRSLMINLTAPIMLFGRLGFQSLLAVDKEATRLSKVFDSVAMSAEQAAIKVGVVGGKLPTEKQLEQMNIMLANFKALDKELTKVSSKFGVSKDIVVGLAAEFAELGIVGQDNVVILAELTTTIEKLGGMDIGEAKDLSQALYFNAKRALEANGAFRLVTDARERETMAIKAAQVQLNMFNAIENVTTLTLQDLAKALPEVGSMATAFGLSMTEAAAMLAPMAAAGLDVGASATSIKTSLQRLILPTKKNIDFMAQLSKQYGVNTEATESFKNTTKTSLVGLEAIVDVFSKVKESAAGQEGALKLMSQLFEKRQGPRMYIAIEQLAMFNKELKNTASAESKLAKPAEDAIRAYNELNNTSLKATIDNFKDIGILARVASGTVGTTVEGYKGTGAGGKLSTIDVEGAKKARDAVAKKIKEDRQKGIDSFADITTEAGKAMMVQLAGPLTAGEIASQELEVSLASLSVSVQKIKNNFKLFAAEILRATGPAIKWLSAKLEQFQEYWEGLTQETRDSVAKVVGFVLLFLAALGPVVIAMGTFQASVGVLGRGFALLLPKIRNADGTLASFGSSAETARQKIDKFYQTLRNKMSGGIKAGSTLDALGIASSNPDLITQASATAKSSVIPPKFIPTPNAGMPPSQGKMLENYLASIGKTTTDYEKVLKTEQMRILKSSGFSSSDISLAKGSTRGPGGRFLPMTPGSAAVRTAMAPGGIADRTNAENILFAKMQAQQTALHAKKMADIAQENALKMQAYNGEVLAQSMNHQANLAHEAKMQATKLKNEQMSAKGITTRYKQVITDTAKGKKGTMVPQRVYNGMDISEDTANKIGRGGIKSRFTKANIFGKKILQKVETESGGLTPTKFARGMFPGADVAGPIRGGGIKQGLKNAGRLMIPSGGKLVSDQGAANVRGVFNAGKGAVKDTFSKSMQGGRKAVADLAFANKEAGFGKEAGNIRNATTAMKGFMGATKGGTAAMKLMKLALISSGIGVIILLIGVAVMVIVKNFDKFKSAGAGAFATIKEAFTIFKNALKEVARPFLDLFAMFDKGGKEGKSAVGGLANAFGGIAKAVKFVANLFMKFVVNVIQPYLYMIINIVMFVVSIFKGNWKDAFGFLLAAVSQVVKFVIQGFVLLVKGMIQLIAFGIKLVIGYFTLIPKAVAKAFGWLSKLPGMGFLNSVGNGIDNVIDGLYGLVDAGKGAAFGAVDAVAGAITGLLDKGVAKGVQKSKGEVKGLGDDVKPEAEEAGEAIAQSTGDGFADALDLAGAMKKEIAGAVQELQDYVAGELKNAVDKYLTQAENALKKQKDAALKVFQVQIETLDKLEKAQESLTRTMAYESDKRKRIDDKALTDEQYRRNYALAVYEGRVDDARMLQLEQGLDEKSFTEDMKAIETKRSEELAKENLDALKNAINEAKDAAGKFFDESLIKFQEAAALITKFPPVTIQDYQDQVGKLHTITTDAALANSTEFGNMFETFVTTINDKMPNKVIGAFSMSLDALVIEAQKKYGLGGNPEDLSIIGVTLGMLAGIGDTFGDEKQTVVDAFGEVSTGLVGNFTAAKTEILRIVDEEFLEPFAASTKTFVAGFETIYTQAILDGNTSITNSLRNNVAINKELFEEMNGHLDATTKKWLALKVQAEATAAAQEAAKNTGGGDNTGGTSTGYTPTAYDLMEIRRAKGMIEAQAGITARPTIFAPNNAPKSGQAAAAGNAFIPKPVFVPTSSSQTGYKGYAKGGVIPSRSDESGYIGSGFINAPTQEGVPALLHGGEYIVNAKAVARLGIGALEKLNNNLIPRFEKGGYVAPKKGGIPFGGEDKILANSTKKTPQPLQGPYATSIPVIAAPTINLKKLPLVKNNLAGEGGVSTVRSASFGIGKGEVLLPTVVQGKILSDTNAFNAYANGGYKNHLGIYASTAAANKAAEVIHLSEANRVGQLVKAQAQKNTNLGALLPKKTTGAMPGSDKAEPQKGLSWWQEILRPKNSFPLIGSLVGGRFGGKGGSVAGAVLMGGVGEWVEQLFDNKPGFQAGDIVKNSLLSGVYDLVGIGVAKALAPVMKPVMRFGKSSISRFLGKSATNEIIDTVKVITHPNLQPALPSGPRSFGALGQGQAPESVFAKIGEMARINGAIPMGRSTVPMPTASAENILMHGGPSELLGGVINPEFIRGGYAYAALKGLNPLGTGEISLIKEGTERSQTMAILGTYKQMLDVLRDRGKHEFVEIVPNRIVPGGASMQAPRGETPMAWGKQIQIATDWIEQHKTILAQKLSGVPHSTGVSPFWSANVAAPYSRGADRSAHLLEIADDLLPKSFWGSFGDGGAGQHAETPFFGMAKPFSSLTSENIARFATGTNTNHGTYLAAGVEMASYLNKTLSKEALAAFHQSMMVGNQITPGARGVILKQLRDISYNALDYSDIEQRMAAAMNIDEMLNIINNAAVDPRRSAQGFKASKDYLLSLIKTVGDPSITSLVSPIATRSDDEILAGIMKSSQFEYMESWRKEQFLKIIKDAMAGKSQNGQMMVDSTGYAYFRQPNPYDVLGALRSGLPINDLIAQVFNSDYIPKYKKGGYVPGSPSKAIPAMLHGGEYVVNAKAVNRMGADRLEAINSNKVSKAQTQRNTDLKNAGLAKNFIGPILPVAEPEKKGIFAKAGGFVVKSLFDLQQSFVKFGNSANNIAMGVVESPLALFDKRLSYNPMKNLQNRNQHDLENGINYIRGINNLTGLNLPGGKSDGFGQVANNKLMNMGDAFNIITTVLGPEVNAGLAAIGRPFARAVVGRMGLSASGMTLGQIMKPGVAAAMNNALTREAAILAEREAFDLVYHASPIQGLKTLLPNPASAEGINAIPKVWTFDAAKTTADNAVEKLLPYADSTLNAGDRVGSIYIGGARGLKPSTFAESPISWTDKSVGVLQEIVTSGKTRGQIAKELEQAIQAARSQQMIKSPEKFQMPSILKTFGNMFSKNKTPLGSLAPKPPSTGLELFRPPLSPQVISREAMRDAEQIVTESFELYRIGTENIGFGLPRNGGGFNLPSNFKNVDLNPYDISGLSQFSKEGQAISRDWISAHIAYKKQGGTATNLIDALLYAGKRGDTSALMQFNNYAQAGRKIIQQAKDDSTFSYPMANLLGSVKRGGLDSLNLDDLFLVHETQFAPPLDAAGNIALRPTADYKTIFPSETPTGTMEYIRDTIHMSINHIVQGHQQRANIENAHYIVARLKDVIDANPGALDNLYTVDTWFTPKPGEGLKIPTGSFKTFTGGSSPGQKVNDAMNALSQTGKLSDQAFFRGGEHGSNTVGADELLRVFGKQLNTGFGPHFDSPFFHNAITYGKGTYNIADSYGPHQIAVLSDNAISRLFSRNNMYSGVKKHTEWIGDRFKSGGYVPGAPSMEVPAILHGGEYVVNADAVRSMGVRTMQSINRSKFNVPSGSPSYSGGGSTSVSTVNINVETFVGEEEWFKSMMKSYNVNVLPKMNKAAGNESRTFTSYNGIN